MDNIADAKHPHMGLTFWEHLSIAKNYLSQDELQALELIVSMYLDYAEYQAGLHFPMTIEVGRRASTTFWRSTSMRSCRTAAG